MKGTEVIEGLFCRKMTCGTLCAVPQATDKGQVAG